MINYIIISNKFVKLTWTALFKSFQPTALLSSGLAPVGLSSWWTLLLWHSLCCPVQISPQWVESWTLYKVAWTRGAVMGDEKTLGREFLGFLPLFLLHVSKQTIISISNIWDLIDRKTLLDNPFKGEHGDDGQLHDDPHPLLGAQPAADGGLYHHTGSYTSSLYQTAALEVNMRH